jgi:hypothetical protein
VPGRDRPGENREEGSLLRRDLHTRNRAQRRRLGDERSLHVVGRRAVRDEIVTQLRGEQERFRIRHRPTLSP